MEIKISETTTQLVDEYIWSKVQKEKANVVMGDLGILKANAVKFLSSIQKLDLNEAQIAQKIKMYKNMESADADNIYSEISSIIRKNVKASETFAAITQFQNDINNFFNRNIYLTIVGDGGQIYFMNEEQEKELLKKGSKNKARINFSFYKNSLSPAATLDELVNNVFIEESQRDHIQNVRNIYLTSIERYDETFNEGKKHGSVWKYIYWKTTPRRTYGYTNGRGTIGEAYVLAIFEDEKTSKLNGDLESSIENFYYNYITAADSRAGAIAGDIANSITDKVQFAVKNAQETKTGKIKGFSSESFTALVDIARIIIEADESMTVDEFAQTLEAAEKNSKYRSLMNKQLISNMKGKVSEEITKYIGDVNFAGQ